MTKEKNSVNIDKWIKLIRCDGIGPIAFARLLKYFDNIDDALGASTHRLEKVEGIGPKTAESILASRDKFDTEKEIQLAKKLGIWIINLEDSRYPAALKRIYDPPPVLYVKGTLKSSDALAVAIVGTRRCTTYGTEQSSRLGYMLASAGFTITSGLASGIDTAAHLGAIKATGRTIAVQGCGLAHIFPPENKKLFGQVADSGACISELPLEFDARSENFPARNRIISGLSMGVIVVESAGIGGAMITAAAAVEQNREVMALPSKVDSPVSVGPHRLIKEGARLVHSIDDVMESLGYIGEGLKEHASFTATAAEKDVQGQLFDIEQLNLSQIEKTVLKNLDKEPAHIDEVIGKTALAAGQINSALICLRLKGLINQLPGNMFTKK
jgi:DNA processing protein